MSEITDIERPSFPIHITEEKELAIPPFQREKGCKVPFHHSLGNQNRIKILNSKGNIKSFRQNPYPRINSIPVKINSLKKAL